MWRATAAISIPAAVFGLGLPVTTDVGWGRESVAASAPLPEATRLHGLAAGAALGQPGLDPTFSPGVAQFLSAGALNLIRHLQRPRAALSPAAQTVETAAASGGAAAVRRSSTPAPASVDVLVNDPLLDSADFTTQSETSLAVLGSTICAGYNDTGAGGAPNSLSGFSRSDDLGTTWTDQGVTAPLWRFGDPVLAVHEASGTFYYAELALIGGSGAADGFVSVISVARSTDDCRSFGPDAANASPTAAAASVCQAPAAMACSSCTQNADCDSGPGAADGVCAGPDAEDKPWITVDNTGGPGDGTVYVCWSRFVDASPGTSTTGELRFSRSLDGGLSFRDEQVISPPGDQFPLGCQVQVGAGGEVYATWADRSEDFPIRFRRSFDGGITWDPAVQVNSAPIRHPGVDRIVTCGTTSVCGTRVSVSRPTLNRDIRMAAQAWMAVDTTGGPFTGTIYVVWAHDPPGVVDNSDIFLSRSTDGGVTWSPELQIAGGTLTDQFEPFVAVGGAGTVSIAWYDRRNDPARNSEMDIYATFSRDGGVTLDPIVRLTDVSFPAPPLAGQLTSSGNFDPSTSSCYMGEYIAVVADAENFYYAWGDNRNTVVSDAYPRGRPDPDVYFERRAVPAIAFCVGDCDGNGVATVDELLTLVNIALGNTLVSACTMADGNGDGQVTVDELLAAVNNSLGGCPAG